MKRAIIIAGLLTLFASALSAQALIENEYYQEGERLLAEAESAFDMGDYDAAVDFAARAEEQFGLSDEYVERALLAIEAQKALDEADALLAWAQEQGAEERYPDLYSLAESDLDEAHVAMVDKEFEDAIEFAELSMARLSGVSEAQVLPAQYTVVLNTLLRDCLWRIAGLPVIYNDPFQWEKLYKANRKSLVDPNNPHLIVPGQVLDIPSLFGEKRSGMYDPKAKYEALRK